MVTASDVQRLFLQAVLSRKTIPVDLAKTLHEKCIDAVNSANPALGIEYSQDIQTWDGFLNSINASLDKLDLEFSHESDETTGVQYYALVNKKDDEIAKMATDYTPNEIAFFKTIFEQIALAPYSSFCVSSMAAIRAAPTSMTKVQAENTLGSFVAREWLVRTPRGRYTLGNRAKIELKKFLSSYAELIDCNICHGSITHGARCQQCNEGGMHDHCYVRYRQKKSVCPLCGIEWPARVEDDPLRQIGERAFRPGQDDGKPRKRKDVDDEEEDEPSASQQASQREKKPSKSKGKGKQKAKSVASDEEEEEMEENEDENEEEEEQASQMPATRSQPRRSTRR